MTWGLSSSSRSMLRREVGAQQEFLAERFKVTGLGGHWWIRVVVGWKPRGFVHPHDRMRLEAIARPLEAECRSALHEPIEEGKSMLVLLALAGAS